MPNHPEPHQLEQLQTMTRIVADTGDIRAIERCQPIDATTNPSLLLKAAQDEQYTELLAQLIRDCPIQGAQPMQQAGFIADQFSIAIGEKILSVITGRISTEVDANLSFDVSGTIKKARELIQGYRHKNVDTQRVLIKIAATWEGLEAARILTLEGIHCNLTLIFNLHQAAIAAQANVYLISPFVGRILDWHKQHRGFDHPDPQQDPGVRSVKQIDQYLKQHGRQTLVMGASFRHIGQIQALAGCDALTIAPHLLEQLQQTHSPLPRQLPQPNQPTPEPLALDEAHFRWALNQDAMAHSLLAQGIHRFDQDHRALLTLIHKRLR